MPVARSNSGASTHAKNATTLPGPVNIQRLTPIHSKTAATSVTWQNALKAQNSVWQFYQLTMTQWPVPGSTPGNPGLIQFSFPGAGAANTAFANRTLETWDQTNIRNGCMNCHNAVKDNDFVCSLQMNAFTPAQAALGAKPSSPAVTALRSLLQENIKQ